LLAVLSDTLPVAYSRRIDAEVLALGKGLPAVDHNGGAGDAGDLVGGKEQRRISDIAGSAEPTQRYRRLHAANESAPVRLHSFGQDIAWLYARELHRIERHRSTRPPRGHLSHESFLQLIADLESDSMRVFTSAFESVKNQIETVQKTDHT
jgi:hypothetical protein